MSVSFNDDPEVRVYEPEEDTTPPTAATTKNGGIIIVIVSLLVIAAIVGGVVAATHNINDDVPSVARPAATSPSPRVRSIQPISTPSPPTPPPLTCQRRETPCHDEDGNISSCSSDGDCPCLNNKQKCRSRRFGSYCDVICCESGEEERCHDDTTNIVSCANISDGGCPCSKDGEVKCPSSGVCTKLCCDDDHQTCYDRDGEPFTCELISSGGCPCPDGKEKCGATVDWAGYCVPNDTCCVVGEASCRDMDGNRSCKKLSEGGCPPNMSYEYWKAMIPGTLLTKGSPREVNYFYAIRKRMDELALKNEDSKDQLAMLRGEEAELFHTIRLRERNLFDKKTKKIVS